LIESFAPKEVAQELSDTPFSLSAFFRNFVFFRIVVDVVFYSAHRFLHENKWVYNNIHRRHHEHYTTNLRTNLHFSAVDLFIQSAFPIACAVGALRFLCRVALSRFEIRLFMTYAAWHETGAHLGKPLPVISMHPPLSILYTAFTDVEKSSIEFHEVHHNRRHCNYGITQWIDQLMSTRVLRGDKVDFA
jgi:sterol desaturase/sphingolipid hydroxylase (fatty acid hydroxylase superfamily)